MRSAVSVMFFGCLLGLAPAVALAAASDPEEGASIGAGLVGIAGLFIGTSIGGWLIARDGAGTLARAVVAAAIGVSVLLVLAGVVFAIVRSEPGFLLLPVVSLIVNVPIAIAGAALGASIAGNRPSTAEQGGT